LHRHVTPATGRHAARVAAGAPAIALSVALALSACGSGESEAPPPAVPGRPVATSPAAARPLSADLMHRSPPVSLRIPRIGVSAPVSTLGLRPDGTVEEPPLDRPDLAGWYGKGPSPGELGPSVILGHVDARKRAAVFYRLRDLRRGDRVQVTRQDGSVATFIVDHLEKVAKAHFPTKKVYGEEIDYSGLRLVTCGGSFNTRTGHYNDNVIAYTRMAPAGR
jgi:Sortase domain